MNNQSIIQQLETGQIRLHRPRIPWVPHYCVVSGPANARLSDLLVHAERIARTQALAQFGDAECFTLIVNAGRTRRVPWPHVHVLLAPTPAKKRRAMFWLALKHFTRPRRWFRPRKRAQPQTPPESAVLRATSASGRAEHVSLAG